MHSLKYSSFTPLCKRCVCSVSCYSYSTGVHCGNGNLNDVVLIDSVRTPFVQSNGLFREYMSVDLQREALSGLLNRSKIPLSDIGQVICGTVIQECHTSNVAREAALTAGLPDNIPCNTVSLACISSSLSIYNISNMIKSNTCNVGIAAGVELLSDYPIRYNRKARTALIDLQKAKNLSDKLRIGRVIMENLFSPDLPSVTEYTTKETMGHSADRLAAAFSISRREQDEFALRSNQLAAYATKKGFLKDVLPMFVSTATKKGYIAADNGIRVSSIEELSKLKPAFIKPFGSVTAGNASFLSDGASAALLCSKNYALSNNLRPRAYIVDTMFVAQDPKNELLLSPAYIIPKILDKAQLSLNDIDVFEIHEAFAGQVLANMRALESDWFCQAKLHRKEKVGTIPLEKLNCWGGSLSIGHPFGATGIRLVSHAANRLIVEGGQYALIAACAAGGHGVGMLLKSFTE